MMEGKGPYRIYDPGGSECQNREESSSSSSGGGSSYRQLLEENSVLRERMKGLKSLGDLLEESQMEASKLRKRVEELVRDNEALKSATPSFASSLCMGTPVQTDTQGHAKHHTHPSADCTETRECMTAKTLQPDLNEVSSEFEVVNMEDRGAVTTETQAAPVVPAVAAAAAASASAVPASASVPHLPQENMELASQLQRLESSFSVFAEESNPNQLLAHLGRMAVEFHHLSSKVQKNEQRTSLLQTLCEQLRQENNELRKKMEEDLQYRNRDLEQLRQENQKLKEQIAGGGEGEAKASEPKEEVSKEEPAKVKVEATMMQQTGKVVEKTPAKTCDPEVYEKRIKLLEKQRKDVLEVNKQWDVQWTAMKTQFEQKITDLRQRLADSQKAVLELEAEREQRQRDYDKKLLLAKSKIENVQSEKEVMSSETCELKQKVRYLQDQLLPLTKQREYQEKEIQRLNRALEEALNLHSPSTAQQPGMNLGDGAMNLRYQEALTQIAVLKEQVKIFEEDFRKERSDRERMNEEKEDLRRQVERLQGQMTNLTNQLHQAQNECQRERSERCKLERLQMHHKQEGQAERRTSDPSTGAGAAAAAAAAPNGPMSPPYCGPFVQVGHQGLEGWPIHFPPRMPNLSTAPGRDFQAVNPGFPWQSSFPQPRGSRGQGDTARPPPENADASASGYGKRERQNVDPGKH